MNNVRNKNLRKLSNTHVLPSVAFLILTIICAGAVMMILMLRTLAELTQERFDNLNEKAATMVQMLCEPSDSSDEIVQSLINGSDFTNNVFVLDKEKQVLAGVGDPTFKERDFMITGSRSEENGDIQLFVDKATGTMSKMDITKLSRDIWHNASESIGTELDSEGTIYTLPYWVRIWITGDRCIMIKCSANVVLPDIERGIMTSLSVFWLLVIPITLLIINMVLSILDQKRVRALLYYNPVTEGRSFNYYEQTAANMLNSRDAKDEYMTFVDLTLMKYRSYCNYHGVHSGEKLLGKIDKSIGKMLDKNEVCAFTGDSTFALFLHCESKEEGMKRVEEIMHHIPADLGHHTMIFHAGICFAEPELFRCKRKSIPDEVFDPAIYFNCASAARVSLNDDNVTQTALYDAKLMEEQLWEHKVEERMDAALENEEFQVYIQPKYDPATEKLAGAEALVRWVSKEDGFVSPGRFIPIFEKNGFITKLDDYMLEHIAQLQANWIRQKKQVVPISVNVSRAHFASPDLAEHICGIVDKYDVPHNLIEIELTESAFFDDRDLLLNTVHKLRAMGFEISMDDFGAGYSSLNSLKDLPLDVLKLDADFFRGEDSVERGEIVVAQAIKLAKKLNMRIVAEGIEKKEQVDFLIKQGCDMIQGYYFAKPMPAEEYAEKL